jgi:hypothetical protein
MSGETGGRGKKDKDHGPLKQPVSKVQHEWKEK